jgi:two-component system NarL family response regulator
MVQPHQPYRVLIVDDVAAVRQGLRWVIEDAAELTVVGEAGDGEAAMVTATALRPDVVVLDVEMPQRSGYEVCRLLKGMERPPLVVFLTVHCDPASKQRALAAGGDGFVDKGAGWGALLSQIRQLLSSAR